MKATGSHADTASLCTHIRLALKTVQIDVGSLKQRFGLLMRWQVDTYPLALPPKATKPPPGPTEGHTCRMSSSWRILILSLSIWILWSRSFCCCCCCVVSALGILMSPAGGFWGGWLCWLRELGAICCWCWWFITAGGKNRRVNDQGPQHLIKKRSSECFALYTIDSWDSLQSTFLLIITGEVIITLI